MKTKKHVTFDSTLPMRSWEMRDFFFCLTLMGLENSSGRAICYINTEDAVSGKERNKEKGGLLGKGEGITKMGDLVKENIIITFVEKSINPKDYV